VSCPGKSMLETNEIMASAENSLGNRLSQIDEDWDFTQDIDAFRPDHVLTVDCGLNEQLICAERNMIKLELAVEGFLHVSRRRIAQLSPHGRCDVSQRFQLRYPVEVRKAFFVCDEIRLEQFPIIVQPSLNLAVPEFGVLGRKQNDARRRPGLGAIHKFYGADNRSRGSCLEKRQ
jgi:hypothetical protein